MNAYDLVISKGPPTACGTKRAIRECFVRQETVCDFIRTRGLVGSWVSGLAEGLARKPVGYLRTSAGAA